MEVFVVLCNTYNLKLIRYLTGNQYEDVRIRAICDEREVGVTK